MYQICADKSVSKADYSNANANAYKRIRRKRKRATIRDALLDRVTGEKGGRRPPKSNKGSGLPTYPHILPDYPHILPGLSG